MEISRRCIPQKIHLNSLIWIRERARSSLAERVICNDNAGGSIPLGSTKLGNS